MGIYENWRGRGIYWLVSTILTAGFLIYGWVYNDNFALRISGVLVLIYFSIRATCYTYDYVKKQRVNA